MIYGYLSDTALAPFGQNNTNYNTYSSNGTGVGHVTERVMSMLNTDMPITTGGTTVKPSPGLIIDPRTSNGNMRCTGLFKGESTDVTNIADIKAAGVMSIHYDAYQAQKNADSPSFRGNLIENVTEVQEIVRLFNVIETITMSHYFDSTNSCWIYRNAEFLESALSNYSYNTTGYGYVPGTLRLPPIELGISKSAKVKNVHLNNATITDTIGTNPLSNDKSVVFADYIQFSYQFSELEAETVFTLYLNPEAMITQYPLSTITHVVMPLSPEELFAHAFEENAVLMLGASSQYVSDRISNEVYKADVMSTTNYTGAQSLSVTYLNTTTSITFTSVYKGRTPTVNEQKTEIYNVLHDYLVSTGEDDENEIYETIRTIFPNLITTDSYTIVPFYGTRVKADVANSYAFCRDTLSIAFMERVIRAFQNQAPKSTAYSTLFTIPGYLLHCAAIADLGTGDAGIANEISEKGIDANEYFNSYQPLSSLDVNWITMSSEAQELAMYVQAIVGAELNNTAIPTNIPYTLSTRSVAGVTCTFYVFSIGTASFSVMMKDSYSALIQRLPE